MESYSARISLGNSGRVVFRVESLAPIRQVAVNFTDDGQPSWTIDTVAGTKEAAVAGLRYTPTTRGTFNLAVSAVDADTCRGTTGRRRAVVVE